MIGPGLGRDEGIIATVQVRREGKGKGKRSKGNSKEGRFEEAFVCIIM